MDDLIFAFALIFYIVASRLALRFLAGSLREVVFALLNIAGVFYFLIYSVPSHTHKSAIVAYGIYLFIILFHYILLALFSEAKSGVSWLAFFAPIASLIVI